MHWKKGQIPSEDYSDEVQLCRDGVRKAEVKLKLTLARDTQNNERASRSMLTRKGRSKKVYIPIKNFGKLIATDEEKADVPFSLSFQ